MELCTEEQRAEGKRRAGKQRGTMRRRRTTRQACKKKALPKEGEVRLVMQLTAGDWALWRLRRWETRAMAGDEDRAARTGLAGRKRKWAEVLTLHGPDYDEEDDDPNEREERQWPHRKRMKIEAEAEVEEAEADPTMRLNPILDQCHITNN